MNDNMGSFGALAPDEMAAVKDALQRRGMGDNVPALNQQSAAGATPAPLPPQAQGGVAPTPTGIPGEQMATEVSPEMTGAPVGSPEAELIIKALQQRLQSLSKVEQAKAGLQ